MLQERDSEVPNPKPQNFRANPNVQYSKSVMHRYFGIWLLKFVWNLGFGIWPYYWVAWSTANLNFPYARNTCRGVRFKNRRQCHFYALRRSAQLGTQKLSLADADGAGMLRDRIDGRGSVAL